MHALRPETKCALIQRSCGYSWRQSLSVDDIRRAIKIIKVTFSMSIMESLHGSGFLTRIRVPIGIFVTLKWCHSILNSMTF